MGNMLRVRKARGQSDLSVTVSVVIPCYNAAPFLRETLDSVLGQTHQPLEVIVVDDGSTDESAAIAESYGPPVRVIRQRNRGESSARNRGIEESQGDWIALLDADDIWKPEKLEQQLRLVTADVAAVHTPYFTFGAEEKVVDPSRFPAHERYTLPSIFRWGSPCTTSSLLVRRDLPVRFPEWTQFAEDCIYVIELTRLGQIALVPEPLVGIRLHRRQQSARLSIEVDRHETMQEWLRQNERSLDPGLSAELRSIYLDRVERYAELAYWTRQLDDFRKFRRHLASYHCSPATSELLSRRIYPRWVYAIKDLIKPAGWGRAKHDDLADG